MQLFSERSVRFLLASSGYEDVIVNAFTNTYSLQYWIRLAPLPVMVKSLIPNIIRLFKLDKVKFGINVGNMITTGFKRA